MPLFEQSENLPDPEQTQKGFFDSLDILTRLYDFEMMEVENKSYPYNILLVHADIQKQFRKSEQDIELKILRVDDGTVKLATNHTYNTGTRLYYIPILPLLKE